MSRFGLQPHGLSDSCSPCSAPISPYSLPGPHSSLCPSQLDLGQRWPTVPLSPGWRTALCTAGSRSSSNIITLFLPCLYLLLSTLQSSLSQRGSLGCFTSSLLSYLSAPLREVQSRPPELILIGYN